AVYCQDISVLYRWLFSVVISFPITRVLFTLPRSSVLVDSEFKPDSRMDSSFKQAMLFIIRPNLG
ncbi:MAG: hypothetical protein AAF668_14640, partial [Pseudomonadota bacterium]